MNDDTAIELTAELLKQEAIVEQGLTAFGDALVALRTIRDQRLYLGLCDTWDVYLDERWGKSRSYTSRLIQALNDSEKLPIGDLDLKESHYRKLREYPEDLRPAILKLADATAKEEGQPITAGHIEDVGNVLIDAMEIGGVMGDDDNGIPTPLIAAITEERAARVDRQKAHIKATSSVDREYVLLPRQASIRNTVSGFDTVQVVMTVKLEDGDSAEEVAERLMVRSGLKVSVWVEKPKR